MPSSTISSKPARVLLVDDNDTVRARAARVLGKSCEIVGTVEDGPTAIEVAQALQPDVIVLYISMPGMTGFEVAARLRETGSRAAIVFLTVHDDEACVLAAKAAGVLAYVVKSRLGSDLMPAVSEARAGRPFVSSIG